MKAVINTSVSTKDQTTQRQVNDLSKVDGFSVVKTFSENISGFSKSIGCFNSPSLLPWWNLISNWQAP